MVNELIAELHDNGVHVECTPAKVWLNSIGKRVGNGMHTGCVLAGKVERLHSHDHEGPLVCGCPDD